MKFDNTFFGKETRCDFEIPALMKRVWAAELEVLRVVTEICKRNGIQYYASYGTLLGAVRHGGFIPWDDDIDISVKREGYQRLIEILPNELPEGFCLHGIHAPSPAGIDSLDNLFQIYVAAERNQWDINEYIHFFHGYPFDYIGIDIFPIDYASRDPDMFEAKRYLVDFGMSLFKEWEELKSSGRLADSLIKFEEASGIHIPEENQIYHVWRVIDAVSALCWEDGGDSLIDIPYYKMHGEIKKEWYDDVVSLPFENIELPVPCGYDEILTALYGDWHKSEQGTSLHGYPFYEEMEQKLLGEMAGWGLSCSVEEFCEKVLNGEISIQ